MKITYNKVNPKFRKRASDPPSSHSRAADLARSAEPWRYPIHFERAALLSIESLNSLARPSQRPNEPSPMSWNLLERFIESDHFNTDPSLAVAYLA